VAYSAASLAGSFVVIRVVAVESRTRSVLAAMWASSVAGHDEL
jgi:hypothetical protein